MSVGNIYKYARDGLPRVLRTLAMTCEARAAEPLASSIAEPKRSCACAMTCIKPGMTHGKEIPGQAGGFRGRSPLGEGVAALRQAQGPLSLRLAMEARGILPPPSNQSVIPFGQYFCNFIPAGLEFY